MFNRITGCALLTATLLLPSITSFASDWQASCPAGFSPAEGDNQGFISDEKDRRFHVFLPDNDGESAPVFVALTGTVQPELNFSAQSKLDKLTADGWIVLSPWRACTTEGFNCSSPGQGSKDGRVWEPWHDGHVPVDNDEGIDVRFVESMVKCAATQWSIDPSRIYIGGISAGGSFTNRNMTFNSDFFAGGVNASGNWYGGLVEPKLKREMDESIVITVWGGPTDKWPLKNPIADYSPETRDAANFYATQQNVVHLACTGSHGHMWPSSMTDWFADVLLSHPKGSDPKSFKMPETPEGLSCVLGKYTDH